MTRALTAPYFILSLAAQEDIRVFFFPRLPLTWSRNEAASSAAATQAWFAEVHRHLEGGAGYEEKGAFYFSHSKGIKCNVYRGALLIQGGDARPLRAAPSRPEDELKKPWRTDVLCTGVRNVIIMQNLLCTTIDA